MMATTVAEPGPARGVWEQAAVTAVVNAGVADHSHWGHAGSWGPDVGRLPEPAAYSPGVDLNLLGLRELLRATMNQMSIPIPSGILVRPSDL